MNYILYKNPIELRLLAIVRYLHYLKINSEPNCCIERNYPNQIIKLPTIYCVNEKKYYNGLQDCIKYYEYNTNISDLYAKSLLFMENNPSYRIH